MPLAAGSLEKTMRVRFLRDFDWSPPAKPMVTIARLADQECTVTRAHGVAALAAKAAVTIETPKRIDDAGT